MILHDESLLGDVIKIARTDFANIDCINFNYLFHAQTIARQAMLNGWPDFLIAACWLHGIRYFNEQDAIAFVKGINEFSEETASVLKTITRKDNEEDFKYYKRISESPYARAVLWLDMLGLLMFERDHDMAQNRLRQLIPMYPSDIMKMYQNT